MMQKADWNGPNTGEAYQCKHGRMFREPCPAEKKIAELEAMLANTVNDLERWLKLAGDGDPHPRMDILDAARAMIKKEGA